MLILGMGALARPDGAAVLAAARAIAERYGMVPSGNGDDGWNGFNLLHTAAARVGGLDLGFVPGDGGRDIEGIYQGCEDGAIEVLYLLGADELKIGRSEEHTSELQTLMRNSYAVFCLKKTIYTTTYIIQIIT